MEQRLENALKSARFCATVVDRVFLPEESSAGYCPTQSEHYSTRRMRATKQKRALITTEVVVVLEWRFGRNTFIFSLRTLCCVKQDILNVAWRVFPVVRTDTRAYL